MACPRCASSAQAGGEQVTLLSRETEDGAPTTVAKLLLPRDFAEIYETDRVLGAGATGTVYLAHRRVDRLPVAVKFLNDQHNPLRRARFQREIALMRKLDHVNVVRVRDHGDVEGYPYLILEYLDGGTLAGRIKAHGRLPPSECVRVMKDVLSGLVACHDLGIIHRDMKPENVLFTAMGRAKITDLGLAKDQTGEQPGLTASNAMFGTPYYMSPEQIKGAKLDVTTDIYSCGVMLYEMATGSPPFVADNAWELFERHINVVPPSLGVMVPYAPRALADAVDRALAKSAADRFPRAADFLAAIEAC